MKKILFLVGVLMLAVSCGQPNNGPSGPAKPSSKYKKYAGEGEIKVMSFNVRTKTSNDKGINHWDERKSACVALVRDHKPCIIGFQEAQYNSQWTYLMDQLKLDGYQAYGVNRSDGKESGTGEVVGIMWNSAVVRKIEVGTFWLSLTPDKPSRSWGMSMNRTATWGLFEHIPTGKQFFYLNTHLPLTNDDPEIGDMAKVEGMKLIAKKLMEYEDECALFLTGDFNVEMSHEAMTVIDDFMKNARLYATYTDSQGTTNGWGASTSKKKIDHIYYSSYLKRPTEYYTITDAYNGVTYVSDHYPIYAIIKL